MSTCLIGESASPAATMRVSAVACRPPSVADGQRVRRLTADVHAAQRKLLYLERLLEQCDVHSTQRGGDAAQRLRRLPEPFHEGASHPFWIGEADSTSDHVDWLGPFLDP